MTEVTIARVNTDPFMDRKHCNLNSYSQLWIRAEDRTCGVCQVSYRDSTPSEEYFNYILTYDIDEGSDDRIDSDDLSDFLNSESGQKLLARICDGWTDVSNAYNLRGELDEDAEAATDELLEAISELNTESLSVCKVEEWLNDASNCGISALTTNDELNELEDTLISDARYENVLLDGNVLGRLTEMRDELRDKWVEYAKEEFDDQLINDVETSHHLFDKNTLEVKINFADGKRAIVHVTKADTVVIVQPE